MSWPIFITAPNVTAKQINNALIHLQDYEYGASSSWVILRHRVFPDNTKKVKPDPLPVDIGGDALSSANNDFSGYSPDQVYEFIAENEDSLKKLAVDTINWLIIDEKGFATDSCLLGNEVYEDSENEDDEESKPKPAYNIARIPWVPTWSMYVNLDLGNMGFEEWVDEDAGPQEDDFGAYKWVGPFSGEEKDTVELQKAVVKAREDGIID